ncbi:MAG: Ig-like domain-containing protein [Alicyclobacillus sp.]|nr:Ig-like domain-containing protein [Alicyclobacillus sp.]
MQKRVNKACNLVTAGAVMALLANLTSAQAATVPQSGYFIDGYFFASADVAQNPQVLVPEINGLINQDPAGLALELNGYFANYQGFMAAKPSGNLWDAFVQYAQAHTFALPPGTQQVYADGSRTVLVPDVAAAVSDFAYVQSEVVPPASGRVTLTLQQPPVATNSQGQVVSRQGTFSVSGPDSQHVTIDAQTGTLSVTAGAAYGVYTVTYRVDGVNQQTQVTVAPGAPAAVTAASSQDVALLVHKSQTLTFTVADSNGNPVPGVKVDFGVTGSLKAAGLSSSAGVTDNHGQVSVSYTDDVPGDSGTVTAAVDGGGVQGASGNITVVAIGPAQVSSSLTAPVQVTAGKAQDVAFSVIDSNGDAAAGVVLDLGVTGTLQVGGLSKQQVVTDATGQAAVTYTDTRAGDTGTVVATVDGQPAVSGASAPLTVLAADPAVVTADVADAQNAALEVPLTLHFTVEDAYGNPVSGTQVDFITTLAAAQLSALQAVTDSSGRVSVNVTDPAAESGTVTATVHGTNLQASTGTLSFAAQLQVNPAAAQKVTVSQPQTVTFTLTDGQGQPLAGMKLDFGVTGTLKAAGLSATSAVTDSRGQASVTYTDATAGDSGSVTATLDGTQLAQPSGTLTVVAVGPSAIATDVTEPVNLTAGQPLTVHFTVTDQNGNPRASVGLNVSTTGTLPASGLSKTLVTTDTTGTASVTFTDTKAGDTGTVVATAANDNTVQQATGTITVEAGPVSASQSTVSGPANPVQAGTGNVSLTVTVADQYGNPIGGLGQDAFAVSSDDLGAGANGVLAVTGVTESAAAPGTYSVVATDEDTNGGSAQTLTVSVRGTALAQTASVTVESAPQG